MCWPVLLPGIQLHPEAWAKPLSPPSAVHAVAAVLLINPTANASAFQVPLKSLPLPSLGGGRGFLVFGGSVAYGLASDKAYHYDEDVNCWAEVAVDSGGAGSPSARFQLAGMSSGETAVTVVGGRDFGEDLSDLWRCDIQLA